MRSSLALLTVLGLLSAPAIAQEAAAPAAPAATPEIVYATEEIAARRFLADEQPSSFTAAKDDRLEVLVRDAGGWVRVKKGRELGWVPGDKTTSTVPEGAAGAGALTLPEGFKLPEGMQLPPGITFGGQ